VARREELGHPLGTIPALVAPPAGAVAAPADSATRRDLVLEIGSEELPPDDVVAALEQLRERVPALLQRLRLAHAGVQVRGCGRGCARWCSGRAWRTRACR
jgi:glycyl-tRNA synthetase